MSELELRMECVRLAAAGGATGDAVISAASQIRDFILDQPSSKSLERGLDSERREGTANRL